jgi:hypothetical protein
VEQISRFVDTIDVDLFHKLWNSVEQCGTDLLKFAQKSSYLNCNIKCIFCNKKIILVIAKKKMRLYHTVPQVVPQVVP